MTAADGAPGEREVAVVNRQRFRSVRTAMVEAAAAEFLSEFAESWNIGVVLVGEREMARVNRAFLGHEGSTDVITFDHGSRGRRLCGELYISVPDAVRQGAEFGAPWTEELLRYLVHGILHLAGYDDHAPRDRRTMKRAEERWLSRVRRHAPAVERPPAKR